jgi:hypothetical protein
MRAADAKSALAYLMPDQINRPARVSAAHNLKLYRGHPARQLQSYGAENDRFTTAPGGIILGPIFLLPPTFYRAHRNIAAQPMALRNVMLLSRNAGGIRAGPQAAALVIRRAGAAKD